MFHPGAFARILVLCGLALTTLASAKTVKENTISTYPSAFAVSERLSDLPIELSMFPGREMPEPRPSPLAYHAVRGPWQLDPVLQKEALPEVSATQGVNFDGIGANGWIPSDSNLAVGTKDIGEIVNVEVAFYSKNGAVLSGPTNIATLFNAIGGNCADVIWDPIVLYDRQADRWLVAGIGTNNAENNFSECVAVSTSNDPTASYALYSYSFGSTLNDYDKLSVWATATNSAYLATCNLDGAPADLCGFDRTKMLAGNSGAAMLCQKTPHSEASYLPSDMDGPTPPVDGTPGLFLSWHKNNPGELYLRKLTLDFASGTATLSNPATISVANDNMACGSGGICIPQAGTTEVLDSLGDRLMYRFAIRHFADHDRAVVNHAVENGNQVAIRWYEIYDPAGNVTVNQQGTFAPDETYRWMAGMAEDQNADIGLGYSASSSSINPAIRFTGRVPSDPAGSMESEASIIEGTGSETGGYRWGDYTAMQVDPSDDCTFWYVDQYEPSNGTYNWSTRIGSFVFTGCSGSGGSPSISFNPTSLKWGKVLVGHTGVAKNVTVTNTGTATLDISNIAASGDFALAPSGTKACGSTLAASASCIQRVTFTPTQKGTRTGNLTFTDNAPGSPQNVALSGTGK